MKEKPILLPYGTLIGAVSVVVLTFGASSCSIAEEEQEEDDSRIQLTVSGNRPFWHPSFPDSVLTTNNSLFDSKGLAGLELEVLDHSFTAFSFFTERTVLLDAPASGPLWVTMRLLDGDQIVAQGNATWNLQPRTKWYVIVTRGLVPERHPHSKSVSLDDLDQQSCQWLAVCLCSGVARMRIGDWAANFPGEAIWLHWFAIPTDLPDNVIIC